MTEVDVLTVARREFREAIRWYRERSPRTSKRFALEVKSAIAAVREHPEQYPRWDDRYRYYLLKKFPCYVAYRHSSDKVVIVAVRHAAQDADAWLDR
jgi:plasmid stabilization system protein ParE